MERTSRLRSAFCEDSPARPPTVLERTRETGRPCSVRWWVDWSTVEHRRVNREWSALQLMYSCPTRPCVRADCESVYILY